MKNLVKFAFVALLSSVWSAGFGFAGEMPMASPESVGLSSARLAQVGDAIDAEIAAGSIAGGVLLVARHGKVAYVDAFGLQDKANGTAMDTESLFRLFSMTKPIVSVAVLMLNEQGRLLLNDPVEKYLPEFADATVAEGKLSDAVAANRPVTVQDLLRHTSGLTYGVFGDSPVKAKYREADTLSWQQTNAEMVTKIAAIPLAYQPGTVWDYGQSTDVLAHVVEVVTGQTIDTFLQDNILGPLGMNDTGYVVAASELSRVAEQLPNPDTGAPNPLRDLSVKPNWLPGGQGLVSTASDYWRFSQMLLNRGELDGVRILSPTTVDYMTSDHLGAGIEKRAANMWWVGDGYGFGLGVAVRLDDGITAWNGAKGDYYWMGYAGTNFLVSPKRDLVMVFMAQQIPQALRNRDVLFSLIPQTIVDAETVGTVTN